MGRDDDELALFRTSVSCAALLERLPPSWQLDRKQSTRRALKYRRGAGEVLIVNHDEKGWWDPHSTAKGDVFDLVKHLEPNRNFGQVLQVLRAFVGLPPSYPTFPQEKRRTAADVAIQQRWNASCRLRPGSPAWTYLTNTRGLPPAVLFAVIEADAVREGYRGSAWFAHRAGATVVYVEARGLDYRGSLRGGTKSLFRLRGNGNGPTHRLAVTEAPIDALSLAAIEDLRPDTLYTATSGGMGPGTLLAIERALADMAAMPDARPDNLHRPLRMSASRLGDILCHREQRYVGQQLTLSYERKRIMLERNDVTEGTVGQHVEIYEFADGRMEVRWKGISLPYVTFDKDQRVSHTAIVENKRLGAALTFIKAQRDLESSPRRVKTNSEAGGYRKNGRKPGRRSHLVPREVVAVDPSVPLADAPARLDQGGVLVLIRPAPPTAQRAGSGPT